MARTEITRFRKTVLIVAIIIVGCLVAWMAFLRPSRIQSKEELIDAMIRGEVERVIETLSDYEGTETWNQHVGMLINMAWNLPYRPEAGDRRANFARLVRYGVEEGGFTGLDDALVAAAQFGDLETARYLVEKGADVNADSPPAEFSPLYMACKGSAGHNAELIRFLVERGADVNNGGEFGGPPLIYAAYWYPVEIIELLVRNRADINSSDMVGGTSPLAHAMMGSNYSVARWLIDHGADVNGADGAPLRFAVSTVLNTISVETFNNEFAAELRKKDPGAEIMEPPTQNVQFEEGLAVIELLLTKGAHGSEQNDVIGQVTTYHDANPDDPRLVRLLALLQRYHRAVPTIPHQK